MADQKRDVSIAQPAPPHFALLKEGEKLIIGLGHHNSAEVFLAISSEADGLSLVQFGVNTYNGGLKEVARQLIKFKSES